eukprot:5043100-Prymnesium_polylepis.1
MSHPLIHEWAGPTRGAEGRMLRSKYTLSSLDSAPQAQEGPTPRPRCRWAHMPSKTEWPPRPPRGPRTR